MMFYDIQIWLFLLINCATSCCGLVCGIRGLASKPPLMFFLCLKRRPMFSAFLIFVCSSALATSILWTPGCGGRGGSTSSSTSEGWESFRAGNIPRCLGHHEAVLLLVRLLVLHLPSGLHVVPLPVLLGSLLDEVILHDLQVIDAVLAGVLVA